jgi:Holliday junction DNA helicase RuvA
MLQNDFLGIQITYAGKQQEGEFFLYPYLDDKKKTISYFAFDTAEKKQIFEELLKVNGIGIKTAFIISQYSKDEIDKALQTMDVKFFQAIPGVGAKSAKKILLELKGNIDLQQVSAVDSEQKLFKNIVKSLKNFGYEAETVKAILNTYEGNLSQEKTSDIIKRVISQI